MNTLDRVKKIAVETLGVSEESVTPEARLVDDLGADSLDFVELLMMAEEEFGIDISDDAAEGVVTIGDAVAMLDREMCR